MRRAAWSVIACVLCAIPAFGEEIGSVAEIDTVRVTGSWAPLSTETLPQSMTVVKGEDLRRRGARDLRSAMGLVCGVEAVPGGDSGPAGSVPALWGLREFDAFLLVVDGIPWGGAFIPNLPTLDLNDVDRIEVLRGPAPVTYGSTSFVGVIHVFHRHPGAGESAEIAVGSYETVRGSAAFNLGGFSRLELDGARERFRDEDAGVDRGHARYRMDLPHDIQVDADGVVLKQDPTSPVPRVGAQLDPAIPLDANHNPNDARLDTNRWQLSASQSMHFVNWNFAASHADDDNIRGFLQEGAIDDGSTPNANGYTQERELLELYGQAHHRFLPGSKVGLAVGADALFGKGEEESENFQYYAPLNGNPVQRSSDGVPTEETEFEAERTFLGLFAEADWHPAAAWTILAGARLNYFDETREGEAEVDGVETPAKVTDSETRPSGRLGITWRAWESDAADDIDLYVNAQDTFKPAAIDFGPEAEVEPLDSETAQSIEFGARTDLFHRRLHMDASVFRMDFENLVVSTFEDGLPKLANAGTERFDGVELGAECSIASDWSAIATYAWHDATFLDYEQEFDGVNTSLDGNQLEMSPHHLVSGGLRYHGPKFHAEVFSNYIGERFLNKRNTAKAEAYTTVDASAGALFGRFGVLVAGRNLSDQRDPVAESELGEAQYYRLPARVIEISTSISL